MNLTCHCFVSNPTANAIESLVARATTMETRQLTQPKTQPEASRLFSPSSPRYLVKTFAPSEKPMPNNGASGKQEERYNSACRRSSVWPPEYNRGLVIGVPAPGWWHECHSSDNIQSVLTATEINHNCTITKATLLYGNTCRSQYSPYIRFVRS